MGGGDEQRSSMAFRERCGLEVVKSGQSPGHVEQASEGPQRRNGDQQRQDLPDEPAPAEPLLQSGEAMRKPRKAASANWRMNSAAKAAARPAQTARSRPECRSRASAGTLKIIRTVNGMSVRKVHETPRYSGLTAKARAPISASVRSVR